MNEFDSKRQLTLFDAINEYFDYKEATETLSASSIHNRRFELKRFQRFCDSNKIEYVMDIKKNIIISYLKQFKISKSSKAGIIYILTSFMDYLVDEELVLDNVAAAIDKPKAYIPKADYLTFDELERLFRTEAKLGKPKVLDRNLLLYSLFSDICLRVSEAVNLKMEDTR